MRKIAKGISALRLKLDLILSSPYVRACQTAEMMAAVLKAEKLLKFSEHLAADGDPEELIDQLRSFYHSPGFALLVGHEVAYYASLRSGSVPRTVAVIHESAFA